ncbi:MAG: protein kinase [Terracidiphilus sp.]
MPLAANSRLGHYEIKALLGAGGMGEVYRARDPRLNRDVAIKILREEGAGSIDQRSRFEREARAIAALNHPNIVSIYDVGVEAGQQYIVSELIEGESLRSLLTGKPVPPRKILDIAAQVADGLAAAHAAGIIHRDLKPENIMLAKEGRVKILDFGLAARTSAANSAGATVTEVTSLPNPDALGAMTDAGVIMGTANYMSPEQAAGKVLDFRTDQFSLGLILYALATGKLAFARPSAVETMAAIIREDPPPIEEKLPAPLKWIIDRCLAKEPEQRYESTRDLHRELRNMRDHFSEAYSSSGFAPVSAQRKRRPWIVPAAIGVCCLLFGIVLVYAIQPFGEDIGNYRYTPFAGNAYGAVWSPDGKAVAYASSVNGIDQVFLRYLNSPVPVQLTHEKQSIRPVRWSSDRSHLILIESNGSNQSPPLKLVSVATVGGDLDPVMTFDCISCDLSPDGKAFATLLPRKNSGDTYKIAVSDPLGSPMRTYAPDPFASKEVYDQPQLAFSPDGKKILYFRAGDAGKEEAWLLPFPAGSATPKPVLQALPSLSRTPTFSWMPDSRHVVVALAMEQSSPLHLWMADTVSDSLTPITTGSVPEGSPVVAPSGRSLLYEQTTTSFDVVSVSLEDGSAKSIVSSGRAENMAAWSAKAGTLAWVTNRNGPPEIWVRTPDHVDRPTVTEADFPDGRNRWLMNPALSPDGERLIFTRSPSDGVSRLWIISLAGGAPVRVTNAEPTLEWAGVWSPDGSRFAYMQSIADNGSLMVVRTSGNAKPVEIAKNLDPFLSDWSPTGDWITCRDDAGWHMVSPDGKSSKFLGKIETSYLVFSRNGKLLYGIRTGETEADQDRATLFSLDPVSLKQRVIKELGPELRPASQLNPGIRFSLSADGKSIAYTTAQSRTDLWMLRGYRQPGWLGQFTLSRFSSHHE